MSAIVRALKLPRKLDSIPRELRDLAQRTFYFASDVYDVIKIIRDDSIELRQLIEALQSIPPGGGGGGVTDHADLTGLGGDDHTQYLLADGSRDLGGDLSADGNTITNLGTPVSPNDAARLADIEALEHGYYVKRNADAPPSSTHADDDECDGGALDPSWTLWDPHGTQPTSFDATAGAYDLIVPINNTSAIIMDGYYKAVPASEFVMTAKASLECSNGSNLTHGVGIFVAGNLASSPTTADWAGGGIFSSTIANGFGAVRVTASDYAATINAVVRQHFEPYLRLALNGTDFNFYSSVDGLSWHHVDGETLSFTPVHCGFFIRSLDNIGAGAAAPARGTIHWMRFTTGTGSSIPPHAITAGRSRVLKAA